MGLAHARAALACVLLVIFAGLLFAWPVPHDYSAFRYFNLCPGCSLSQHVPSRHPIAALIADAQRQHASLIDTSQSTAADAAQRYRQVRGRHPPPHFDRWMAFARQHQSPIAEEFFDQIYEDLEPFWGVQPDYLREQARSWDGAFSVRNGQLSWRNATGGFNVFWIDLWTEAFQDFIGEIPDVDMPVNNVDEPRISVPWEDMNELFRTAVASRHTRRPTTDSPIVDAFTSYPDNSNVLPNGTTGFDSPIGEYWSQVRGACHPNSPARTRNLTEHSLNDDPHFESLGGRVYVKNFTSAMSVCERPYIAHLHGSIVHPGSTGTSRRLFPLFGATKISGLNNDILLPAAMYYSNKSNFIGGTEDELTPAWETKKSQAFWRGWPSGGLANATNWKHFHRQRVIAMMNGSMVARAERLHNHTTADLAAQGLPPIANFPFPNKLAYDLAALETEPTTLGKWTSQLADAAFTVLDSWLEPYFAQAEQIPMSTMFHYKWLPDLDGMSYSGRFRAFLRSSSMPIKSTIYSEWHYSRLIPWYHFVPMDMSARDWWGILEYFGGYDPASISDEIPSSLAREAHDADAASIAGQGQRWGAQALRREDMNVYVYRLLLEYARICDDRRDDMGWVADLT